jgi:hypothetical protein
MDVCDKVTTEDSGAKEAVASMIKRLAHRNANVQLYTLEVEFTLHSTLSSSANIYFVSSPMPSAKTVAQRCTGSWLLGHSQTPFFDWQMTVIRINK